MQVKYNCEQDNTLGMVDAYCHLGFMRIKLILYIKIIKNKGVVYKRTSFAFVEPGTTKTAFSYK